MNIRLSLTRCAAALALLFGASGAQASIVMDWNAVAIDAVQTNSTSAPEAARNLAAVHAAIYDAVNGIDRGHQVFHVTDLAPQGASVEAAAAAAANAILSQLYPAMASTFDALYQSQINAMSGGQATTDGINYGQSVATQIYNWRVNDGSANAHTGYTASGVVGHWAQTPPTYQYPPVLPKWGNVTTYALTSGNQFRPSGPQSLTSVQYATDYQQVYDLGANNSALRTADQTEAAMFWSGEKVTATEHWNQIARHLLGVESGIVNEAVVLAALNVTLADAGIAAWDAKYTFDHWRPVQAIQAGDEDGNPMTVGDPLDLLTGYPGWLPLLDTPATPEYLSENATLAGAAAYVLTNYLGNGALSYWGDTDGDGVMDTVRSWSSLMSAADEAALAQIYAGVNFAFSVNDGKATGQNIGEYILDHNFAVIPEPSSLLLGLSVLGMVVLRRRRQEARACEQA